MDEQTTTGAAPAASSETLLSLFRRASHFMARVCHHQGHAHHAQRRILGLLKEKGALSQRELLEILGVRSASLSELLAKLERGGFIIRERDQQDRRSVIVDLTGQGRDALGETPQGRQESAEMLFAPLSPTERQTLEELLTKLIVALEEAFPDQASAHRHHEDGHRDHDHCGHGPQGHGPHGHCPHGRDRGRGNGENPHGRGRHSSHGEEGGHGRRHGPDESGRENRHEGRHARGDEEFPVYGLAWESRSFFME